VDTPGGQGSGNTGGDTQGATGGTGGHGTSGSSGGDTQGGPCANGPTAAAELDGGLPDGDCGYVMEFACGLPQSIVPRANCFFTLADCHSICPTPYFNCHALDDSCVDGGVPADLKTVHIECQTCPRGAGRRPEGLAPVEYDVAASGLGTYFASVAHLEAASVHAFRALGSELASHGAPRSLVRSAARAAEDEIRHARVTARLARRHGGKPARVRVRRGPRRSIEALAVENMVEGCVRETFGAVVATWQAARAEDPSIRRAMEQIAEDETRHAALGWAVAAWAHEKLDAAGRARVEAARRAAIDALRAECAVEPTADLARDAGMPSAAELSAIVNALSSDVWS
jgi:hypothetical protein